MRCLTSGAEVGRVGGGETEYSEGFSGEPTATLEDDDFNVGTAGDDVDDACEEVVGMTGRVRLGGAFGRCMVPIPVAPLPSGGQASLRPPVPSSMIEPALAEVSQECLVRKIDRFWSLVVEGSVRRTCEGRNTFCLGVGAWYAVRPCEPASPFEMGNAETSEACSWERVEERKKRRGLTALRRC